VQDVATAPGPGGTTVITTTNTFDPDGNTVSWTRQTQPPTGPVQTQTDSATYDAADRQTSGIDNGLTTAYGYDAAGQQRTHTIVDGATAVATTLDAEGRAIAISEGLGGAEPYTGRMGYNLNDLPVTMSLPGGIQEALGYDASSRLTSLTLNGPASSPATTTLSSSYAYGYNPLDWTTSTTTLSGTDTLVHDAQGRLTSESGPQVVATGGAYRWTYDNNGNLLSQTGDDGYPVTYTYTQAITPNQLQTMVMGNGQPTTYYGYDNRGDTTAITNGLGLLNPAPKNALNTHISYDSQARPVQITFLDRVAPSTTTVTATVTLAYNPAGQRSEYTLAEPGQPTLDEQFTYRGGMLGQLRVTKGGTLLYTDTYLYTQSGAPYELLRTNGSGATSRYWYEVDGRGNVVALTDVNGKVVDRYAYDSWGELTSDDATNETVPQQLRYAGYWYDEKLSWYWLQVRYYDPEIERFLQPDPSEQDGVRTYAYVGDGPIDATDPDGLADRSNCLYAHGQAIACAPTSTHPSKGQTPPSPPSDPCNVPIFGEGCARNVAAAQRTYAKTHPPDRRLILVTRVKGQVVAFGVANDKLIPLTIPQARDAALWLHLPVVAAAGFFFHPTGGGGAGDRESAIVVLYKAPQSTALAEYQMTNGYKPEDFEGLGAFFAREKGLAGEYSHHYNAGIIEVHVPADVYSEKFAGFEVPYIDNPQLTEVIIPPDVEIMELLSSFPRFWDEE